jgi:hypothetical protein
LWQPNGEQGLGQIYAVAGSDDFAFLANKMEFQPQKKRATCNKYTPEQ